MLLSSLASTSRSVTPRCAGLHTSPFLRAESTRKQVARATKKQNIQKKEERLQHANLNKPSPVLGTRPGEEAKWQNCDLAKVLVKPEDLNSSEPLLPIDLPIGRVDIPKTMNYGVSGEVQEQLFNQLPYLSSEAAVETHSHMSPERKKEKLEEGVDRELQKTQIFAKIVDLRNANAAGIAYENRRRIIAEFSDGENAFDTGRTEVQAALLTYKIRNLWSHLTQFKRDVGNRRGLRKLVHQRAKILRYLKRTDRDRYDVLLERLALDPESVEGELVV
ncbi:hypothetical protein ONZ45_g11444 [Pleurotus djamor]|nr:hypothetical protein ONZ45_g11444 [Pleurotus djamor]